MNGSQRCHLQHMYIECHKSLARAMRINNNNNKNKQKNKNKNCSFIFVQCQECIRLYLRRYIGTERPLQTTVSPLQGSKWPWKEKSNTARKVRGKQEKVTSKEKK